MSLFSRFQKHEPAMSDAEVTEIRARVRSMREQVGKRDVDLADLFELVKEDERPVLREIKDVKRPEPERFWPDQVPSSKPSSPNTQAPAAGYGTWQSARTSSLPTTP